MKTFLWYDLETYGLNSRYDRIAQIAAIRTDMDLNQIGEPIEIFSKLSPDYLPSPNACLVTRITPQEANQKGIIEAELISKFRSEMLKEDTITVGFNSIKFDDEVIRSTLYRNLYDPYEREYKNGCSRWDIINLIRATADLRPEGINFSIKNKDTGYTSFKLTDLTKENNIDQTGAHDALVDVRATIAIAKLIKEKQPQLFNYALNHRSKQKVSEVINVLNPAPFLLTSSIFVSEHGNTHPLLPLFMKDKSNDIYCFDLTKEISENPSLENLKESGIVIVSINKCPFVAPLNVLDEKSEKRLGFTKKEVLEKANKVKQSGKYTLSNLSKTIIEPPSYDILDPDIAIYQSFLSRHDKVQLEKIRNLSPEEKLKTGEHFFDDDKLHKMLWRHVARNWPKALSEKDLQKWKNFCALRLLNPPVADALNIEKYLRSVDELLNSLDTKAEEKAILIKLRDYGLLLKNKVLN